MKEYRLFINGAWADAHSGRVDEVLSPSTGEVIGTIQDGDATDAQIALETAELAQEPIDVFTVCPGAVDTPMFRQSTLDHLSGKDRTALIKSLPDKRLIEPKEIAELVRWLCSPAARVLRGAVLDASLGLGVNPGLLDKG